MSMRNSNMGWYPFVKLQLSANVIKIVNTNKSDLLQENILPVLIVLNSMKYKHLLSKFLDAGIQDVSTSISIVHDLIEISPDDDDGDESDKHI